MYDIVLQHKYVCTSITMYSKQSLSSLLLPLTLLCCVDKKRNESPLKPERLHNIITAYKGLFDITSWKTQLNG